MLKNEKNSKKSEKIGKNPKKLEKFGAVLYFLGLEKFFLEMCFRKTVNMAKDLLKDE